MSIFTLIKKDLKIVLSDKKALVILVAMPIILYTILSFALVGSFETSNDEVWDITIGIVKEYDMENIESEYLTTEDAETLENILFDVLDSEDLEFVSYTVMTYEEATQALENNNLSSVVILPENYISDLGLNMSPTFRKPIDIQIIRNTEKQYSSDIVENIIFSVMENLSQMMITNKVTYETLNHYDIDKNITTQILDMMRNTEREPVSVKTSVYNIDQLKMVNSGQYYSTAMMAMFLLFGASYGAKFMLEEKRDFTLQRQQSAGIHPTRIVIGKMALIFIIAVMQIGLMILTSTVGFKVYWGEPIQIILVTLITALAVTGFGSFLAAISLKADNFKALNMMESGIFQILALFGGSYFPLFLMPDWFKWISRLLLNGAALEAYQKVMMDAPLNEMLPSLTSLLLNSIVFLTIGLIMIHRQPKNTLIPVSRDEVSI
ncbi:MAG: ABC transporter permease [Clostridiales bacterium]|nr:ABC transporter permease [Clostridiales bacterium]